MIRQKHFSVIVILIVLMAQAAFAASPYYVNSADKINLNYKPLGSAGVSKFEVKADLADYKEAILLIRTNDVDAPEEADLFINDKKLTWPKSVFGDDLRSGAIVLSIKDIKPGINELKLVRKSNLNNTTAGCGLEAAQLQLFKELSPQQKSEIIARISSLGGQFDWTEQPSLSITSLDKIDLWGKKLGAKGILTLYVDTNLDRYKDAILLVRTDDVDAPEEADLFFNGKQLTWPQSAIGEGRNSAAIPLSIEIVKTGFNELKFVCKSDLNNTTTGCALIAVQLQLFEQLYPKQKTDIFTRAADLDELLDWNVDWLREELEIITQKTNWKSHAVKQGDGKGGLILRPAEYKLMFAKNGKRVFPFGLANMGNGRIAFLGTWNNRKEEIAVIAFSKDSGRTWSDFEIIPGVTKGVMSRPMMLAYLGNGVLTFTTTRQHFSYDYGRTWTEIVPSPGVGVEGNFLIDRDVNGVAVKIGVAGYNGIQGKLRGVIRWSNDGSCKNWTERFQPLEWIYNQDYKGKLYDIGVSEGALVRAANGWIVAALRTDMPPQYLSGRNADGLEGTGVSISKDDGKTWSPVKDKVLFAAGRMHANLLKMPNDDLIMTMIVRNDIKNGAPYGELASRYRGCDALISHDNGLTWNLDKKYTIDEFAYYDPQQWFEGQCGHLYSILLDDGYILTVYGNQQAKAAVLIRWKPDAKL